MTKISTETQPLPETTPTQTIADVVTKAAVDATLKRYSAHIEDAATQAAMQPWIAMECYQLSHGRCLAKMDTLSLGGQQVVRETQLAAVQKLGVTPPGLCTLSYCTAAPNFRFSEYAASCAKTIFFMPECTEFDIYVPAGQQTAYISFNQEDFLQDARALNPAQWDLPQQQLLSDNSGQQPALAAVVKHWLHNSEALSKLPETHNKMLNEQLLQQVLHIATASGACQTAPSMTERTHAFHICRKARVYITECFVLDIIPTISAICIAVGVSERSLQYAFRAYVNMSPLAYLRSCRLSRVRSMLNIADPKITTVTAIAMRFGFFHLGRFALDYKLAFGESPSVTLESYR
ncbi:helix-turn-helix domain-containing protein [Rheinheimera sp. NSM]|uniref:helix-turn-helix domain-containing protein n=1 Tax=Rheinheimera sp. NSM TaxID=3457884 RepID=UPI004036CA2B